MSVVQVGSLGLLLGRDWLDSIGCVLSFAKKIMRADHLSGNHIKLHQLTAGHFALRLIPSCWPTPGLGRWRRVGQDGVVALQISHHEWLSRKLQAVHSFPKFTSTKHEHLLSEHSMHAADLSLIGLPVEKVDPPRDLAHRMIADKAFKSTTTSPTSSLGRDPSPEIHGSGTKARFNMAAHAVAPRGKSAMARARHCLVALSAAVAALCTLAVPVHHHRTAMAFARPTDGRKWSFPSTPPSEGTRFGVVHSWKPEGVQLAPRSFGLADGLHGRPNAPWNDGRKEQQRSGIPHSSRGPCGSEERGRQGHEGRQAARGHSNAHWTSRRSANSQGRSSEAGGTCGDHPAGEGYSRRFEEAGEAHRPRHRKQDASSSSFSKWSKFSPRATEEFDRSPKAFRRPKHTADSGSIYAADSGFHSARSAAAGHTRAPGPAGSKVSDNADPGDEPHDVYAGHANSGTHAIRPLSHGRSHGKQFRQFSKPVGSSWMEHGGGGEGEGVPREGVPRDDRARVERLQSSGENAGAGVGGGTDRRPVLLESMSFPNNPWAIHQELKKGQAQQISQAWEKHCRDREAVSKSKNEVLEAMKLEWDSKFQSCLRENFIMKVEIGPQRIKKGPDKPSKQPLVGEIYTATEQVAKQANLRGHRVLPSMSLENGWNFLKPEDRRECIKAVMANDPYCLVLAFPCGPWSPLTRLQKSESLGERRKQGRILLDFALILARMQLKRKAHFILENPKPSLAWTLPELAQFIETAGVECVDFDQCAFGLRSKKGWLHKKPTRVATSSSCVADELRDMKCSKDHDHQPVLGGSRITSNAGHYPIALAKAFIKGLERQFHADHGHCREVLAVDGEEVEPDDDTGEQAVQNPFDSESDISSMGEEQESGTRISSATRLAVKRLHENTGHRSNRRLARALVLAGAPAEVIAAAQQLRCSICDEKKRPKSKRPSTLPSPKDVSDQVHIDIFESSDINEQKYYVVHCIDWTSRFQMGEVMLTKDSESICNWFKQRWLPIFGPPRVLIADQGREFISWAFQQMCDEHSILLYHIPVQAPWANGICEKGGGILKGLLECCIKSKSVAGLEEMNMAFQECVLAYNADINEAGVSPCQAAIGRQPRMIGDVLGNFSQRLAEHGLIDSNPSFARQVALREVARLAMVRLHFSRGIRRAELSRSRSSTMSRPLEPGDIVYFWRESKYNSRTAPSKKRLSLRRWHGPALLVALEGHTSGYVSFKGQLTKCSREHLRLASSMEQISADVWHDAIRDCVESALHDARRDPQAPATPLPIAAPPTPSRPSSAPALPPVPEESVEELPPVAPVDLLQALDNGNPEPLALPGSGSLSRRASTLSSFGVGSQPASVHAAPGTPVPALIRQASQVAPQTPPVSSRMEAAIDDARELEEESSSRKRTAEVDAEALREEGRMETTEGHSVLVTTALVQNVLKTKNALVSEFAKAPENAKVPESDVVSPHKDTLEEDFMRSKIHPLRFIQELVEKDKRDPNMSEVVDHGSWSGRWPLPSRSSWQAHEITCSLWPCSENEVNAAKTARREVKWKQIPEHEKAEYRKAAEAGWKVQTDNFAFEPLSEEESSRVRSKLRDAGELNKILHPRFIYTDKNDGKRSASTPMPLLANARLVIPGYQDETAYTVRKDAPTSSRSSQHILFVTAASKGWTLWSADIKSAFLKGELFAEGERELYITNIRCQSEDEPMLPFGKTCLAKVRKGVCGLADSPRRWYLRLHRSLTNLGWMRSQMDAAQWFLYDANQCLHGILVSHVDDLLMAGSSWAKQTLDQLGKELGFGSLETGCFNYCGKQVKQFADKTIEVSMQAYHENVQPAVVPIHRKKQLDSTLTPGEHRQLRALLGSLQWLVTQVRFDMSYHLSVLQGEPPTVRTLLRANALVRLMKKDSGFKLRFPKLDLTDAGILVITDASLGNVTRSGGSEGSVFTKVFSQAAYLVLVGDKELMAGREGQFAVIDGRSHRLSRVCRSTYGAE